MSAREELIDLARTAGMAKAAAEGFAGGVLDTHAHELAERQRAYAREVGIPLKDGDIVSAEDVIDVIDPQVSSSGPALRLVGRGRCTATLQGWPQEVVDECVHEAGHYDEADPDSWHQTEPDADGARRKWSDAAKGATPHRAGPVRPDEETT
jgi:hypothetical protein